MPRFPLGTSVITNEQEHAKWVLSCAFSAEDKDIRRKITTQKVERRKHRGGNESAGGNRDRKKWGKSKNTEHNPKIKAASFHIFGSDSW